MPTLEEITVGIIRELARMQSSPQRRDDSEDAFELLRSLPLEDDQCISISKLIDQLIADFSRTLYKQSLLQNQLKLDEYTKLVRRAFGPELAEIDLAREPTQSAHRVMSGVVAKVQEQIEWIASKVDVEYAFACTLFSYTNIDPIQIGPVRIESRESWLVRKSSDGCTARVRDGGKVMRFNRQIADGPVSKISKRRILRAWEGEKLRSRKRSYDSDNERNILSAIGECQFVCSVKVRGLGDQAAREKALLAARLSLTAIALMWELPSKALEGMNLLYDDETRVKNLLAFTSDGLVTGGKWVTSMPHAPWVAREKLNEMIAQHTDTFAVSGEAIQWLLNPECYRRRSEVMNILAQAMLWFHDGCRETNDLKAIVSFASCLEILASGGGKASILQLIKTRVGISGDAVIHRDQLTLNDIINEIYVDGRNRYLHGPIKNGKHVWDTKLVHDWSPNRSAAEKLTRLTLVCTLIWAAEFPDAVSPREILS